VSTSSTRPRRKPSGHDSLRCSQAEMCVSAMDLLSDVLWRAASSPESGGSGALSSSVEVIAHRRRIVAQAVPPHSPDRKGADADKRRLGPLPYGRGSVPLLKPCHQRCEIPHNIRIPIAGCPVAEVRRDLLE